MTTATLGFTLLLLTFNLCLFAIFGSLLGIKFSNARLLLSSKNASYVTLLTTTLSVICLVYAFVTRDFSVKYVFNHSNLAMNPIYTWVALYSGNEGSLLYISLIISIASTLTIFFKPREFDDSEPYLISLLMGFLLFFLAVMIFLANPFATFIETPADGRGINPLLAHPGMFSHPPLLMAGLATICVPFSLIISMIFSGKFKNDGLDYVRTTSLVVWAILGIGLLLGSWWAYTILGWGGYWAWDPIENVGLMPWLVMTAFIHSIIVQRRRGMFRTWNIILIFLAFILAQFGMFINRGGPVVSVHSFAASTLGYIFLGFMIFSVVFCIAIFLFNTKKIKSDGTVQSFLSRETAFLINNFFLVAITLITLWGLIFPLISELFYHETVTVGAPYYNAVNGPIMLALLFVMGLGPNLSWKYTSTTNLKVNFLIPLSITIIALITLLVISERHIMSSLALASIVLVLSTIVTEWIRGSNKIINSGVPWYFSFYKLIAKNKKRYGGYIVHISILLVALGIIGINFHQVRIEKVVLIEERIEIGKYGIELLEIEELEFNDRRVKLAKFAIYNNDTGQLIRHMTGNNTFYPSFNMASIRAAIRSTPIEDLYIIPSDFIGENKMKIIVSINPLVWWMWLGGPVFIMGTLIALWPTVQKN